MALFTGLSEQIALVASSVKVQEGSFIEFKRLDYVLKFLHGVKDAANMCLSGKDSVIVSQVSQSSLNAGSVKSTEVVTPTFKMSKDIDTVRDAWTEYINYIKPREDKGIFISIYYSQKTHLGGKKTLITVFS
jgi:hypothetical protein